jgi:hypothetical protein
MDLVYAGIVVGFFGLSWAFVWFCQSMMGGER